MGSSASVTDELVRMATVCSLHTAARVIKEHRLFLLQAPTTNKEGCALSTSSLDEVPAKDWKDQEITNCVEKVISLRHEDHVCLCNSCLYGLLANLLMIYESSGVLETGLIG